MAPVESFEKTQLRLLYLGGRRPPVEICHRLIASNHARALMHRGKKVRVPGLRARVRKFRREHYERRQVQIFGAQPITDPGADARAFECHGAGVNPQGRLEMTVVVASHRIDHADIIDAFGDMREQFAYVDSALTARLELPPRL